jgi:homogentisate 1,2-dioxygenase
MPDRSFANADGDTLIVPQHGTLDVRTELGILRVAPGEILLVPRGIRFAVALPDGAARGWMCETFGQRFRLPERGPIGSNGLADARHFLAPAAWYEDRVCAHRIVTKLGGALFAATQDRSPFDVVAWHGTHVPFKYDLALFNAMGTVAFDHPDPSIHTVLTAPLDDHGRAAVDFVAFVGRWEVAEHTFRPPCFHRNAASEINGIVKTPAPDHGYDPGCTFLTPLLTAHGVTTTTYEAVIARPDETADAPNRIPDDSLWIMFESALPFRTTRWARETELVDPSFAALFANPKSHFDA